MLAECDMITLQEVVDSYVIHDATINKGQLNVYEFDGLGSPEEKQNSPLKNSEINAIENAGRNREKLGTLYYELRLKTTSVRSESNSNSAKANTNVNMIKLEMEDLDTD